MNKGICGDRNTCLSNLILDLCKIQVANFDTHAIVNRGSHDSCTSTEGGSNINCFVSATAMAMTTTGAPTANDNLINDQNTKNEYCSNHGRTWNKEPYR